MSYTEDEKKNMVRKIKATLSEIEAADSEGGRIFFKRVIAEYIAISLSAEGSNTRSS